jgi:uncharacterized protein
MIAQRGRPGTGWRTATGLTLVGVRPLATLLSPIASRNLYPRKDTRLPAKDTDFELSVDRLCLRGWEVNPGRERALVYYGGNGEGLAWLVEELSTRFPDHTSYLVAYRGYGASEGRPSERVLTSDAVAVFDHAAARHSNSVDVVGRSLGSAVAIQVAVRRSVRRLVLITPFDSLVATAADLYPRLPVRRLLRDHWDSAAVAHRLRSPVLVVRAGLDETILPFRTDQLLEKLASDTAVLNLRTCGHDTVDEDPAYWPTMVEFLAS